MGYSAPTQAAIRADLNLSLAEGFECFAQKLMDCHRFSRVKVGVGNTMISHLRFADDTLIFGKVNWKNV